MNLDKLKNKSQLGFLLSSMLKDSLVSQNIIVREIELGKEFELGGSGFNLLTRKNVMSQNNIVKQAQNNKSYEKYPNKYNKTFDYVRYKRRSPEKQQNKQK